MWYLKGKVIGTLATPVTPDGGLKEKTCNLVNKNREKDKTMLIENAEALITAGLKEGIHFRKEGCVFNDPKCKMDPKSDCSNTGIVYEIKCD